jgi:exonuclease SbcC
MLLDGSLERHKLAMGTSDDRLAAKEEERASYADLVNRAKEIESTYKSWQKARKELEEWEEIASQFREYEKERVPLLEQIAVERARLEQELEGLQEQFSVVSDQLSGVSDLESQIASAGALLKQAEVKVAERLELEDKRNAARERQAELKAENDALKVAMNELKERIDSLKAAEGATCPLCGQELSPEHRKATLKQLESEGREKGDRFRANQTEWGELAGGITEYESQIAKLASAENERIQYASEISQLTERLDTLQALAKDWESTRKKRLKEVEKFWKPASLRPMNTSDWQNWTRNWKNSATIFPHTSVPVQRSSNCARSRKSMPV